MICTSSLKHVKLSIAYPLITLPVGLIIYYLASLPENKTNY